jgi:hypothetical protein
LKLLSLRAWAKTSRQKTKRQGEKKNEVVGQVGLIVALEELLLWVIAEVAWVALAFGGQPESIHRH